MDQQVNVTAFLTKHGIKEIRKEITHFPDGTTLEPVVCYVPTGLPKKDPKNNRFRSKGGLADEEHKQMLRNQNPINFKSLVESIQNQPFSDAVKLELIGGALRTIDGHRRQEAAEDAGRADMFALVYPELSEEQREYLAEWSEENPTKLPHDPFFQASGIALPIIEAKSEDERQKILGRLKRRKISQGQIDKAVRSIMFMSEIAVRDPDNKDNRAEQYADQYKAFETVATLRQDSYEALRSQGDFEKVERLEDLGYRYLKANIAHDDIKDALVGLAEKPITDSLWQAINSKQIDTSTPAGLRDVVRIIRDEKRSTDAVADTRLFVERTWTKILKEPHLSLIGLIESELDGFMLKLRALKEAQGVTQ